MIADIDPFVFAYVTSEGLSLDYARVEFNARYVNNEVFMNDCYRFAQVV